MKTKIIITLCLLSLFSCKEIQLNISPSIAHNCDTHTRAGDAFSCRMKLGSLTNVSYSLTSDECSFLSIHPSTGQISGTSASSDAGRCNFKVTASSGSISASTSYNLAIVDDPMVSVWRVNDPAYGDGDSTITLPLREGFKYDFTVDWGDGSSSEITSYNDPDITHDYGAGAAADYIVTIDGLAEAWYFYNQGDKDKLIEVS